jgi:hypothetical protein
MSYLIELEQFPIKKEKERIYLLYKTYSQWQTQENYEIKKLHHIIQDYKEGEVT